MGWCVGGSSNDRVVFFVKMLFEMLPPVGLLIDA